MKLHGCLRTLVLLGLSLLSVSANADRLERDHAAKKTLIDLHFFHKGLGMHIAPDLITLAGVAEKLTKATKIDNPVLKHRYGLTQQPDGKVVGLYNVKYAGMRVGVLGCVACHSGKAAGQFIIGIGNKNIDVSRIGRDAFQVEKAWKVVTPEVLKSKEYKTVQDSAIAFAQELRDRKRENQTQGLVATSVIRKWFYRMAGEEYPEDMPRGAVKVPHLFGYSEKRKVGQFSDGGGNGELPGWGIAVELASGQSPENVREYLPKIDKVEAILGDLLPPVYPFTIDHVSAARGKARFDNTCAKCHGTYSFDAEKLPEFLPPRVIPWKVVKTDHERLDKLDTHFLDLIKQSPLSDIIQQTKNQESYIAPRLHAIWARFPYLHNGSVPNIQALLSPASERPKQFSLSNAGELERFDSEKLGLTVQVSKDGKSLPKKTVTEKVNPRSIYDTSLVGQSNVGHEFYTDLPDADKKDLIEYLKTL